MFFLILFINFFNEMFFNDHVVNDMQNFIFDRKNVIMHEIFGGKFQLKKFAKSEQPFNVMESHTSCNQTQKYFDTAYLWNLFLTH